MNIEEMQQKTSQVLKVLDEIIIGKWDVLNLSLSCFFAGGHLLLEDLPGSGKTTIAKAFSAVLGVKYKRVQFTSDMIPADILGAVIFKQDINKFALLRGPIFTNLLLCDEINRASPKCQSALLEAMEEHQVSIEGNLYKLEQPFFVIATQNFLDNAGTFALPDSQLDRFMICISPGYPDAESEIKIYLGSNVAKKIEQTSPILDINQILDIKKAVDAVHISPSIAQYVQTIVYTTRQSDKYLNGLSTRAGISVLKIAKAWAFIHKLNYILPEHIQKVFPFVATHRLIPSFNYSSHDKHLLFQEILDKTEIPL